MFYQKWENKIVSISIYKDKDYIDVLNEHGKDGWEPWNETPHIHKPNIVVVTFKRPIQKKK